MFLLAVLLLSGILAVSYGGAIPLLFSLCLSLLLPLILFSLRVPERDLLRFLAPVVIASFAIRICLLFIPISALSGVSAGAAAAVLCCGFALWGALKYRENLVFSSPAVFFLCAALALFALLIHFGEPREYALSGGKSIYLLASCLMPLSAAAVGCGLCRGEKSTAKFGIILAFLAVTPFLLVISETEKAFLLPIPNAFAASFELLFISRVIFSRVSE